MSLTPGTQLGAFEIIAAIGKGGMVEVYHTRDTDCLWWGSHQWVIDLFNCFQRSDKLCETLGSKADHHGVSTLGGLGWA